MPQLNQPYTYLGEYTQLCLLFMALLVLLCVYVTPAVLASRACAVTISATKSPLEQFTVPFSTYQVPTSLRGGIMSSMGVNMVGIYGVVTLATLTPWFAGVHAESLQVQRAWGGVALGAVMDTVRAIVGGAANVLGWAGRVSTLLFLLAASNLQGNVPGGYTLATSVVVAATLSLGFWLWVTSESLYLQGFRFWGSFIPAGTPLLLVPILAPIEAVSYVARAFSLGVRLFSNMLAGHTLLAILADFMLAGLGSAWPVCLASIAMLSLYTALILLEIAVSLIQSYVFSVLAVSYLEGATPGCA